MQIPDPIPVARGLFNGELALVTGAAQGIGFAVARAFAAAGAHVLLADRNGAKVRQAAEAITEGRRQAYELEVTSWAKMESFARMTESEHGPLSILVNNAGTASSVTLESEEFNEELDRILRVNLAGPFNTMRAYLNQLERTHGTIINVTSITALVAGAGAIPYGASKAALTAATRSMARELGPRGIRVNAIAPGLTETPMAQGAWLDHARVQRTVDRTLLKRTAVPEDMAGPVLFLASKLAGYVTGVVLPVDGGYTAN